MRIFFLLSTLLMLTLFASSNNVQRGQTYYKYILKPMLGYDGAVFSKKYTKSEWKSLFTNQATEFKKVFEGQSDEFDTFVKSQKFLKISEDLKAFAIYYAKDASVTPSCQE